MRLEIRELLFSDLDALLALYRELHPADAPLPERAVVERSWQTILDDRAQLYLGGFWDGELVAACNAAVIPNLTRGLRPYAVIENVVTAASFRRRGIGSRVLQQLTLRCWSRGCYKIMLMTGAPRREIHDFYEKNGFDKTAKQAFIQRAPNEP